MSTRSRRRVLDDSDSDIEEVQMPQRKKQRKGENKENIGSAKKGKQLSIMSFLSPPKKARKQTLMTADDFFSKSSATPNFSKAVEQSSKLRASKGRKPKTKSPMRETTVGNTEDVQMTEAKPKPAPKSTRTRKRKLQQMETESTDSGRLASNKSDVKKRKVGETTSKRRWIPRTDTPPLAGSAQIPKGKAYCLANKRFVITGQLPSLTREDAADLIKSLGGRVTTAVSGMTRYLVAGTDSGPSKLKKAKEKKVEVIGETQLFDLIRSLPEGKPPKGPKPKKSKAAALRSAAKPLKVDAAGASSNELFVDRFAPRSSAELIGNQSCVAQLRQYLMTFDGLIRGNAKAKKRAALISGPPGIGKSSAVSIVAAECGFDLVEFNASDTRSKKLLKQTVEQTVKSHSMRRFLISAKGKAQKGKVIVMDEVDGMSAGDRGGNAELIRLLKATQVPVVCICNDRGSQKMRSLANHCIDLRFRRPTAVQITKRMEAIARSVGLQCDRPAIEKMAAGTNSDIRQVLYLLQFWSTGKSGDGPLSYMSVKEKLKSASKDLTMGPWDVTPKLFGRSTTLNEAINYYFVDQRLVPLMVFGNYLHVNPRTEMRSAVRADGRRVSARQCTDSQLQWLRKAARNAADGDLVDARIAKTQYYGLMPTHALLSSLAPARCISKIGPVSGKFGFPLWFGKNSTRNKNKRVLSELSTHMIASATHALSASTQNIAVDYTDALKELLLRPLRTAADIPAVVAFMKAYGLTREDWDSVAELGFRLGTGSTTSKDKQWVYAVPTKVKSAFTKACKKALTVETTKKRTVGSLQRKMVDAGGLDLSEDEADDNDASDNDVAKDALLKRKKGGKATAKKKSKRKRKSTKKK